ncbi:uncharacterized protein LOC119286702 [Triticum dicoccoides]|uniref:uncharacterized protein LOC119286702 n=1 Tax=Triticum dicoccoides TaxID=85692 RepID=UPI00188E1C0C|nr:uncharacterized protein LOC119286702 [Triticum dicoccoides]XP_037422037.1 uncharacterized protein LOC119286702 [Triticum dicoccoides]
MADFKVEIDVQSYLTIVDGKRVYRRGKTWDFMVGRDLSVARIKEVVEEKFKWSPDQRKTIWYGTGYNTIPLISESEIAELFDRCYNTKIVRFGVTIENKQQHKEQAPIMAEDMDDQPIHAPFFAWPKQAYEGEYEDDEPVGCGEENTYLHENVESKENAKSKEKNVEPKAARVPLGTLDVDNSYDPHHVRGDDETLLANNVAPTEMLSKCC